MDNPLYQEESETPSDPRLALAAGVAIEHANKSHSGDKESKGSGKKDQAHAGTHFIETTGDFVKAMVSDGNDSPVSMSLFFGFALLMAGLIVWPIVGFWAGFFLILAAAALVTAGAGRR